jgi:PAS domain S-box-containing protein
MSAARENQIPNHNELVINSSTNDSAVSEKGVKRGESTESGSAPANPPQEGTPQELVELREALEIRTETLTSSLALLRATLESTADGVVAVDLSGSIMAYNNKFASIWNFPDAVLQRRDGAEMRDFASQRCQDPENFLEIAKRHFSQPDTEILDVIELKDGRTFERHGFPQRVNQECTGMVITFREVTKYKQAEAALRLSEEKYRLLWATAGDAFVLFDSENRILEANAAVATIFGYDPAEIIGQDLALLQPERLREGHRRGIQRYLATGARTINWTSAEALGLHQDGREIPIEIAFNHLHLEGRDLFAGFIRDITQRKQAEQGLARLGAIIDSSHDAIISKSLEGIITSWNRGAEILFGYSATEAIGQPILMLFPPDRQNEEPQILAQLSRGEGVDHFETVRIRKDGQQIDVSITLSPIKNSAGEITGVSKIARDITGRKHAEAEREALLIREQQARQELEVANRTKDEFLATLSHELRTPLNAILGWSRLITNSHIDEEERARGIETIQRNAQLQLQLIEDILDVSRIITGKYRLEVRATEVADVIESAVESVLPAAQARDIRLQRVLDSGPCLVSGDPARLQQVVWNLLTNAIKFTPKGGRVQIRLERVNSHVEIIVSDTGAGISADVLPHVFERFHQADSTSTRSHGGLGLGLAIVRHIVELHGGTASAASPGLGQGTTFTVNLPLMATRSDAVASTGKDERVHPTARETGGASPGFDCPEELKGLLVLVVDDDDDARRLIKTVLEQCEASVVTASNAQEGLETLQRVHPHVLISDLGMPEEDGYSLIQQVRALPRENGGQTPAAALTAYARVEDRMRVLRSGFQIHLPKPIEPAELVAVVANLAGRHSH